MKRSKANHRRWAYLLALLPLLWPIVGCSQQTGQSAPSTEEAKALPWTLIARHDHEPERFTQGLALADGQWLESSGGYGHSFVVLERDDQTVARRNLPASEFAEGASFSPSGIWLLTWRAGVARLLDDDLQTRKRVRYDGEGWGLTWDGEQLIMSDGSARLTLRDAESFTVTGSTIARDGNRPVRRLNELEHAHGLIWANVFGSTRVAAINIDTGQVCGWLELGELANDFERPAGWDARNNVLNGIAFDTDTGHLHVTGKRWPRRFEISVTPLPETPACAPSEAA